MHTEPTFRTKKALAAAVRAGEAVRVVWESPFWVFRLTRCQKSRPRPVRNGSVRLVGPNWTAALTVKNGLVVAVA